MSEEEKKVETIGGFARLELSVPLREAVASLGYTEMTPIQERAIPILLKGRDLIGQSKTGSGKTAAFGIPALERVDTNRRDLQVLVLSPTRELCAQVTREIRKIGKNKKDLRVVSLSGGHPVYFDKKALEHGAQVVVGTPGRLMDHVARKTVDLSKAKFVVLDEADRMLDMGFRDKIEALLAKTAPDKQTALFSATFPPTIENLAKRYMKNPERVTIEVSKEEIPDIEQLACRVSREEKADALIAFLKSRSLTSVIVFCNLKITVDEVSQGLRDNGFAADKIHGDLEQADRDKVMAKFRNQSSNCLVATDVAARGIDVAGLDAVVNYDMPSDPDQYVHRIGRTGRAGAKGVSFSLVTPTEHAKLARIEQHTQKSLRRIEVASLSSGKKVEKPAPAAMRTILINGGRKDKLRAGDILGALTQDAGLKGDDVGKIEIHDRTAYVAVSRPSAGQALAALKNGKIKGRRFQVSPLAWN